MPSYFEKTGDHGTLWSKSPSTWRLNVINETLRGLKYPDTVRLEGRTPNCSWCGRPVNAWGDTCDRQCWQAWVEKIAPLYGKGTVISSSTIQHPPKPDVDQPWFT